MYLTSLLTSDRSRHRHDIPITGLIMGPVGEIEMVAVGL